MSVKTVKELAYGWLLGGDSCTPKPGGGMPDRLAARRGSRGEESCRVEIGVEVSDEKQSGKRLPPILHETVSKVNESIQNFFVN